MITKERFRKGFTWEEYLTQCKQNVEKFRQKYDEVAMTEAETTFFRSFPKQVYIVAIGEDWCPDVYNNLSVMARIAALNDRLVLRIFPRDMNHDLMHQYLFRGQSLSIPAFGFIDADFKERAKWLGGRPKLLWDWIDQEGKENARPKIRAFYEENKGREALREFKEILEHMA
jgi:hypothetical protein